MKPHMYCKEHLMYISTIKVHCKYEHYVHNKNIFYTKSEEMED